LSSRGGSLVSAGQTVTFRMRPAGRWRVGGTGRSGADDAAAGWQPAGLALQKLARLLAFSPDMRVEYLGPQDHLWLMAEGLFTGA
jgi:hypothetical protein